MKETWAFRRSCLDDLKWLGVGPSFIFLLCVGVQVGYFMGFLFAYLFAGSSMWSSDELFWFVVVFLVHFQFISFPWRPTLTRTELV